MNSRNHYPTFSISYSKNFKKRLSRLPTIVGIRISAILDEISTTGRLPKLKPLTGNLRGLHSIRVGDYRIIVEVDLDSVTLLGVDLGHRREIYD